MFDENEHTHPQNNDEGPRHIHRGIKRSEPDEVEVDSADFFSPEPPRPKAPPKPTPTPPSEPHQAIALQHRVAPQTVGAAATQRARPR